MLSMFHRIHRNRRMKLPMCTDINQVYILSFTYRLPTFLFTTVSCRLMSRTFNAFFCLYRTLFPDIAQCGYGYALNITHPLNGRGATVPYANKTYTDLV